MGGSSRQQQDGGTEQREQPGGAQMPKASRAYRIRLSPLAPQLVVHDVSPSRLTLKAIPVPSSPSNILTLKHTET